MDKKSRKDNTICVWLQLWVLTVMSVCVKNPHTYFCVKIMELQ